MAWKVLKAANGPWDVAVCTGSSLLLLLQVQVLHALQWPWCVPCEV
jgi:hypothetical protein